METKATDMKLSDILTIIVIASAAVIPRAIAAQEQVSDSTTFVHELDEVFVEARESVVSGNKTTYYPSKELREVAGRSVVLLGGLQIPELIVNPATGDVSLSGNGRLSIRINGRRASQSELNSVSPEEIAKVVFITNPGTRYDDADAVLDIYLKRRDAGYGAMFNLLQSPNRGWGNYAAALKYNTRKSEWTIDYNSNPMWNMDCYRDNTEWIVTPDGKSVSRVESGISTPNRMVTHHASLLYSYADTNRLLFNAKANLSRKNDRTATRGLITEKTENVTSEDSEKETDLIKSWQGDLDIYLHYRLNDKNKIFLNIVSSLIFGNDDRNYESYGDTITSSLNNRSCHLTAEAVWEYKTGYGTLTSGILSKNAWNKAVYETLNSKINEVESVNNIFTEWNGSLGNIRYTLGIGSSIRIVNRPISVRSVFLNPRLSLLYKPVYWVSLSFSLKAETHSPTVNQLNPTLLQTDRFQWSLGVADLRPFQVYTGRLELRGNINDLNATLFFTDSYSHHPVMGAKRYDAGMIIATWSNAGHNIDFQLGTNLRVPLFSRKLTLTVESGWHTTVSAGLDYRHTYSQPFVNAQVMYVGGPWWIMAKYNNAYNRLWGEMITTLNPNLLNIGVGYNYGHATFMAGIVNPVGNVALRTKDLNTKAGFDRTYQADGSRRLVWIGISLDLHKGSRRASARKRLENNTDYESITNPVK